MPRASSFSTTAAASSLVPAARIASSLPTWRAQRGAPYWCQTTVWLRKIPAPAAHDDAFAVYQWALKQGYASCKVALYGDSSGGNLALATAVRAKEGGHP